MWALDKTARFGQYLLYTSTLELSYSRFSCFFTFVITVTTVGVCVFTSKLVVI